MVSFRLKTPALKVARAEVWTLAAAVDYFCSLYFIYFYVEFTFDARFNYFLFFLDHSQLLVCMYINLILFVF